MRYCKSYANLNYGTKYLNSIHSIHHEIFIPARSSYLRDHDALCWISVCYNNLLIRKSKWCKSSNEKRHYLNHRDYRFLCYLERINEFIFIERKTYLKNQGLLPCYLFDLVADHRGFFKFPSFNRVIKLEFKILQNNLSFCLSCSFEFLNLSSRQRPKILIQTKISFHCF